MMSYKKARERLIKIYGAECFIDKLKLRTEPKMHYTSKKQRARMEALTYHHIKMKKDGGRATDENGALLSAENHAWFHKQSPEKQAELNRKFRQYKRVGLRLVDDIVADFEIKTSEISISKELEVVPLRDYSFGEEYSSEEYLEHKRKRNERVFRRFQEYDR